MQEYCGYMFDMDGVIYRGNEIIQDAVDSINALIQKGKKVTFITNNSSRTNQQYWSKLTSIGISNISESDVITSGNVAVSYLKNEVRSNPDRENILCVAGESVKFLLKESGLMIIEPEDYRKSHYVVVGFNTNFDWKLGNYAANAVAVYGAKLIGTNPDIAKPVEDNEIAAGTGAMIAFIETASKTRTIILGKPYPYMYRMALQRMGIDIRDALMVGDLLETDIKGAVNLGMDSSLVLTGMDKREDIDRLGIMPTYVIESLKELIN